MARTIEGHAQAAAGVPVRRGLRGGLAGLLVLALLGDLAAWAQQVHHRLVHPDVPAYAYVVEGLLSAPLLLVLAALLVRRRPEHPITWLFVALTTAGALQSVAGTYAHESLAQGGVLPGTGPAMFISSLAQFSFVIAIFILMYVFPTGRPVAARWRLWLYVIPGLWVTDAVALLSRPHPFADDPVWASIPGPLHGVVPPGIASVLKGLSAIYFVVLVAGVTHLIVRFRASSGIERQQLRWFVTAVITALGLIFVPDPIAVYFQPWAVGPALIWSAVGVAILRYRLFDLDRIVSRTLAYAVVVAVLVGVYAAGVLGIGAMIPGERSDLLVAASTLAVAGLFQPVNVRARRLVERRFNRARYDAGETVERFAAQLRGEVALDSVKERLETTTERALAPTYVGLWLPMQRHSPTP